MADVAKPKAEENQENDESGNESEEIETSAKDKKGTGDKKKKNAVSASAAKIKPPAKKRVKAEQAEENKKEKEKDKKKKPAAKAKDEEEDGEDEEDGDEGSEGEENGVPDKAVPLLDQPLEITGSRERKQVVRFIPKEESKGGDADKKVEIPEGNGKPLGEIPRIQYELTKLKSENLKILHRVLYNRVGQPHMIKKNISQFKGFDFDKDSSEYKKKQTVLLKLKNPVLKELCTILDLAKSGKHAELGDRVLDFLLKPEDSGKAPPDPRPKRKGISSKTYTEPKTEEETKKSKAKISSKKKAKSSEDEEDEPMDEEEEDEKKTEDEEDNESVGSEEEIPKKGATKRAPPKKAATAAAKKRAPPAGGGVANKKAKEKEKSESESEHQSETEEDDKEAPAKKNKNPPTDEEIKSYVKSVLEGANLEEITMKTVCKKVYENYPEFDLGHKREFIKNTVKSLISS